MINELAFLESYNDSPDDLALGIVVETWGSAPRRISSIMLLTRDGHHVGSLSGGCVEGAVITEAETLTLSDAPRYMRFDVATDDAWAVGLACGGEIAIHLQMLGAHNLNVLKDLYTKLHSRAGAILEIDRATGALALLSPPLDLSLNAEIETTEQVFRLTCPASPRILIAGATHITEYLVQFASAVEIPVDVIEPRPVFAEARSLNQAPLYDFWPDELPEGLVPDRTTAVVALTHDPKIDDPLLELALSSDCFYIGALGSKKSHEKRLTRLSSKGVSLASLDRIKGPVGLSIGAANPAEIALSIISEITAIRRGRLVEAASLRNRP